jgi:hypothetical protein
MIMQNPSNIVYCSFMGKKTEINTYVLTLCKKKHFHNVQFSSKSQ